MYTINKEIIEGFDKLLESGASKDKLEGFLLFEEVPKKEAIAYLKERSLIGRVTFRGWLNLQCIERFVGIEEFEKKIAGESNNVRNHISSYNNIRVLCNMIHSKYSPEIQSKVEGEKAIIWNIKWVEGEKKEKVAKPSVKPLSGNVKIIVYEMKTGVKSKIVFDILDRTIGEDYTESDFKKEFAETKKMYPSRRVIKEVS